MHRIKSRRLRWSLAGALILAAVSIVLGGLFTVLLVVIEGSAPAENAAGYWATTLLWAALLWGLGALPFGATLGLYASMIWRDDGA